MIFILDNFDSFTYNLSQYFGEIGEEVIVKRRDECSIADIEKLKPELIVISPGPCTPNESGLTLDVIRSFQGRIPILGVCLGHQAIGQVFGGHIIRAQKPVHGKTSMIKHDGSGVFTNLPQPLKVTRYHSLVIERSSLPSDLVITSETEDGEIMGVRHRFWPIEGVQFHPEAILTEAGHQLLQNAVNNARAWLQENNSSPWMIKRLDIQVPPYRLFQAFKGTEAPFFLDSGENYDELGHYSFIGAFPFLQVTAYRDKVMISQPGLNRAETLLNTGKGSLSVLDSFCQKYQVINSTPFPFAGGAVGFFSYDLKEELEELPQQAKDDLHLPYWRLGWYDGVIIYDHIQASYWLAACGMDENGHCKASLASSRIERLERIIQNDSEDQVQGFSGEQPHKAASQSIFPDVSQERYLNDLRKVIEYIYAGDIYQANLTQRFKAPWEGDAWDLYKKLHEYNPAPFAAFLPYPDFQILSSSPERFLLIRPDGMIETRPIKGTRPRGHSKSEDLKMADDLSNSSKDRAELTMIIDLERNDLGRIARFGTVEVPDLIRLETYPTVFHLVSTVSGQVRSGLLPSQILKAVFPGGSITGAPKIRAMEIIEELEPYKRGIYTGSIGYLGFDGSWDLNIVIRTIILKDGQAYINAGGGIVADSVPELEYEETLDKARALFNVLGGDLDHA